MGFYFGRKKKNQEKRENSHQAGLGFVSTTWLGGTVIIKNSDFFQFTESFSFMYFFALRIIVVEEKKVVLLNFGSFEKQ